MRTILLALFCFGATALSPTWGATMCSIARDKVNVRKGPGRDHDVFFQAPLGYPIRVDQMLGNWVRFTDWDGDRGWVALSLLSKTKTLVVRREVVNARKEPGLENAVVEKVRRGEIYKNLAEKDGWIKLGYYDGGQQVGWVRKDLVWSCGAEH